VAPEGEAIREAVIALLAAPAERERLRAAGLARAAGFSWDRTAQEVDVVLERAVAR
jgi:glycosyltransferase involved in cell wall biosynthesis